MTEKQIAASRANGAKSHGPITEEGKQRSSMNALKLGLHSELAAVDGESMEMFNNLRQSFVDRFQPSDPVELDMVERMVSATWRTRRSWATEAEILNDAMDDAKKWLRTEGYKPGFPIPPHAHIGIAAIKKERSLDILRRQEARLTRIYDHAFETLLKLKKLNKCSETEPSEIANKQLPPPQPAQQVPTQPPTRPQSEQPCPPPTFALAPECPLPPSFRPLVSADGSKLTTDD